MTTENRPVLVTGASRGIGAAIAKTLATAGYSIWLNYHSSHDAAREVQKDIETDGGTCILLPFDVADSKAAEQALQPLIDETPPYGFIHNAGVTRDTLLPMMRQDEWDKVIDVHLNSFFTLGRMISKSMIRQRTGRIISIASISGETGQAGQVNYSAAKAGLIGASKALARELGRRNILVNVVSPGFIETDMTDGLPLDKILPMIPLNRVGSCGEVAGVVRFLLSGEADYITGQVISVNGGLYM